MSDKYDKIIACVAIVSLGVAIVSLGLGLYNIKVNYFDYFLDKGNKYFDDEDYKKAVEYYAKALKIHGSEPNAWKYKGIALLNLAVANETVKVSSRHAPPLYSYAKRHIDYYNETYQSSGRSYDYLEKSYQCFNMAVYYNPTDSEAWLYKGVPGLYLFPTPGCDPIKDFDYAIATTDNIYLVGIRSAAWHGKGMVYLREERPEEAVECFRNS